MANEAKMGRVQALLIQFERSFRLPFGFLVDDRVGYVPRKRINTNCYHVTPFNHLFVYVCAYGSFERKCWAICG